jgi:hypothetical protein
MNAFHRDAKAKLLSGGYGTRMHRTKISDDCPAFFFNPHKATNYDFTITRPSFTRTMAKKSEMGNESCFVLPGGESVLEATLKSRKAQADGRKNYRIYDYDGKRGMLQNIPPPTQRDLPPIDWNSSSRRSTARERVPNSDRQQQYANDSRLNTSGPDGSSSFRPSSRQIQGAGAAVLSSSRQR